jgi:hypothetical protein
MIPVEGMAKVGFAQILVLGLLLSSAALGKGHGGGGDAPRPSYGGGHHTESHGGTYKGGSGSSHKGGDYKNPKTNDQYGTHK